MMQHHKYSLTELDNMMPWEREIYLNLLMQHIEEENKRMKQTLGGNKRANFGANNNNNNDSSQINADLYTHREMQELRASLDACRVDITEQRKKTMNSDAKAKVAESKCHELETRTLRAEQITEATEKLLIDTEKKIC